LIRARLGTIEPRLEDHLVGASRRIPFFLEAAIDAYAFRADIAEPVEVSDLPSSPDSAVAYLLEHLTSEQRTIAIALASVQVFDSGLYLHLIRALHLPLSALQFDEFIEWFFVEDLSPGLYKTHDLVTEFVRASSTDARTRQASLDAATLHVLLRCQDDLRSTPTLLALFGAVIEGWSSTEAMSSRSVEALIDAGYLLYDAGYWNELASIAPAMAGEDDHPVAVASEFFAALAARRTEGTGRALDLFEHLEDRASALGRHRRSVDLEIAYLSELSGNYARARHEFGRLDRMATPFDPTDRTHLRSRLYHADTLLMDGRFHDASRLLLEAYEALGHRGRLDWAELVRHRAHVFRFSFRLDTAEDLYLQAMPAAADAPAVLGKLQTNLGQTYCWYDPRRAMSAIDLAAEINLRLGNQIELAKCDAARAIALAKLGELTAARHAVRNAKHHAREAGYPAGVAFAQQAEAVVEGLAGNVDGLLSARVALGESLVLLGTYSHLRAAPAWLVGDRAAFVEAAGGTDWLDRGKLESRLRSYLST
jgi:hypothetical protein